MTNQSIFPSTRSAGLDRLQNFLPYAAQDYAQGRNRDRGPEQPAAVSKLSPYIRYRMISEKEILAQVFAVHGPEAAQKFIEEILWRTYWKGWLELHPSLWEFYLDERDSDKQFVDCKILQQAEMGQTGIEGFDDWAIELTTTGYLHNHARMWFASIWIFTLQLPWTLGADFFLRHLVDADVASNTLSWRWVAGLHTRGKSYLATADNIFRHTGGRFNPKGLVSSTIKINDRWYGNQVRLSDLTQPNASLPTILLVHHDDLNPEPQLFNNYNIVLVILINEEELSWGEKARLFIKGAINDTKLRIYEHYQYPVFLEDKLDATNLLEAARSTGVSQIITQVAPIGPIATKLALVGSILTQNDIDLIQVRRKWDDCLWPHAKTSFFKFKEHISPILLEDSFLK